MNLSLNQVLRVGAAVVLAAATHSAWAASYVDSEFHNSSWTSSVAQQSGPPVSVFASQSLLGGNTGAYRKLSHQFGGPGSVLSAHLKSGATYRPTLQGAIAAISFSTDLLLIDGGDSNAVAYGLLVSQNGFLYQGPSFLTTISPVVGTWTGVSASALVASDFGPVLSGSPALDFSAAGAELTFGYYASNGTAIGRATSTLSGVDNWRVEVASIPEPGTAALLFGGLYAVVAAARRLRTAA